MRSRQWHGVRGGAWLLASVLWAGAVQAQSAAQSLRDALKGLLPNPVQIQQAQRDNASRKAEEICRALVAWADSAAAPSPYGGGDASGRLLLFSDPVFKPVFGKAFDELTASERLALYNDGFLACARNRNHGEAARRQLGTLAQPFQDAGSAGGARPTMAWQLSANEVTTAVRQFRSASGQLQAQLAELAALPAQPASWAAYGTRRAQLLETLRWVPRAEVAPAQARLAQAGARLARPAIDATLRPALALPDDAASLAPLRAASDRLREFDGHAEAADLQAARAALQARRDAVLRTAVAADRAHLQALGSGAGGLESGAAWLRKVQDNYDDDARREPELQRLLADFRTQRDQQLAAAQQPHTERLRSARSGDALASALALALPLPGDAESPAGQQLRAAAGTRAAALRAEAEAAAAVQAAATLQALGPVGQCDLWAAHAQDPEALSPGVADEALDAAKAVAACEAAVKREPQTPRLAFQLARGQLKAGRYEEATEKLLLAAKLGHGGALAYPADLHVAGAPGIEAAPLLARQLYEKAQAAGFAPAAAVLKDFEDRTAEFQAAERADLEAASAAPGAQGPLKAYRLPLLIEGVMARKFDTIPYREAWVKEYLVFLADNIRAICESGFTQSEVNRLQAAAQLDVMNVAGSVREAAKVSINTAFSDFGQNPLAAIQSTYRQQKLLVAEQQSGSALTSTEDPFDDSMADTAALFQRHSCGSPGLARFGKHLSAYVLNEEAPPTPPDAIMDACLQSPGPTSLGPREFCMCFAVRLTNARMSQAQRRELPRKFKATAAAIMGNERNLSMFRTCRGSS